MHPVTKLGGFAETALSEDATRTVAMAMFRRIDLDGNGVVDRRELRKLCESEGLGYHGSIMREMDGDRSGEVSIDEFCEWVGPTESSCTCLGARKSGSSAALRRY